MSRRRIALAVLFVVAVAGTAGIYAFAASKRYDATARVVVHPISASDATFTGIDVLRASGDTPRDLETAAHFFDTPDVISTTATRLSLSPSEITKSLDVHPLAGSNVLLVVGRSSTPELAAQIANGIVQEAISQRTARVQAQVSAVLDKLRTSKSPDAQRRIVDLEALQSRPDPTLETLSAATAPTEPASPNRPRLIASATGVAIVVGLAFLLLSQLLTWLGNRPQAPARVSAPVRDVEHEQALARRAAAIDQRERELQQVLQQTREAVQGDQSGRLDQRVAAVSARERELAKRAAEMALRERRIAESRQEQPAATPPLPEPTPEPAPQPVVVRQAGAWTIQALEHAVAARGNAFPAQVEEWRYYVHFLREYAGADGELPASFDGLIEETFAELL